MNDLEQRLVAFALTVLEIMETDHEWSSETLNRIAGEAEERQLSDTDDEGMFRAAPAIHAKA